MGEDRVQTYQVGKNHYARFSFLNKQWRFSLLTPSPKNAELIAREIERGLDRGRFDSFDVGTEGYALIRTLIARPGLRLEDALKERESKGTRKNFNEAIAKHLESCKTEHSPRTYVNEKRAFDAFSAFIATHFGDKVHFLDQVAPDMIEGWRNKRMEDKVAKPTVNRELKMIKRLFKVAFEKGSLSKNPAAFVKTYREDENAIHHLSDKDVKALLKAAPGDLQQIIMIFLLTGLRYGELCYLRWKDIDFRHKQIIVQPRKEWKPKSLKKRIIPMHPTVEKILRSVPQRSELVFPDDEGKNAELGLRNRIYRIFENADVDGNVKDLRSTFASNAVMSGMPIYTVSKLLGHHDVKITEKHYAHLAPDYMGNAITMLRPKWGARKQIKAD
ncbi:MAG: tyrosine-type recombinase/integrase [Candidatus Omnitrophota bacterium]|jgi:integrase